MRTGSALLFVAALLAGSPAAAATDNCAALDYMYSQARTEFPELANKRLDFGRCELANQEFTCAWVFPTYGFAAAEDQADKLVRCTLAQSGVQKLKAAHGNKVFQLNPETTVAIGRPEAANGNWKLTMRIVTTADWN